MLAATHKHVTPHMAKPCAWATSTGATVVVDALGAFTCGFILAYSITTITCKVTV